MDELTGRQGTLVACRFSALAWPVYLWGFSLQKHHSIHTLVVAASRTELKVL